MRSVVLRDPVQIATLVSETGQLDLPETDKACLAVPVLLAAFREARRCESIWPRSSLVSRGTWAKYMRTVDHLASKPPNDPFETYRRRCRVGDFASSNTRQGARSALLRYAAYLIELHLPVFLRALYRALPNNKERNLLHRAVRMHLLPHAPDGLPGTQLDAVPEMVLSELAQSARFLVEIPPDPNGQRLQGTKGQQAATSKPERRSRSQRKALSALTRLERTRKKTDTDFDWRTAFWLNSVHHENGLDYGTKIMIALLMLTGCRPAELVHPDGIAMQATRVEERDVLRIGLNGAKVTDLDMLPDPEIERFTSSQVPVPNPDRHRKGQPSRTFLLACQTPEARWLHLRLNAGLDASRFPQWSVTGDTSVGCYHLTSQVPHDPWSGRRHPALAALDKRLARIGKAAFPRLQARITPYLFRHALAAGAKATGMSRDDLARLLGHASTRTGSVYGTANQSRARPCLRARQILRVEAPLIPRQKHSPGPKQTQSLKDPRPA